MKYVILMDSKSNIYHPMVFDEGLVHLAMTWGAKRQNPGFVVVSAGFCKIIVDSVSVWGESESLKMKPLPTDHLILKFFLLGGFTGLDLMNMINMVTIH